MTAPPPSAQRARRPSRLARWLRRALIALLLVALLAGGLFVLGYRKASRPPSWWGPAAATAPDDPELAAAVERGVTTALHEPREPAADWQVSFTQAQLNAWFAHRFDRWIANQGEAWPDGAGHPRLALESARLLIGVPIGGEDGRVVSAAFSLAIDDAGALTTRLEQVRVGSLSVPIPLIHAPLSRAMDGEAAQARAIVDALLEGGPLVDDPSITLEDGRRVRLVGVAIEADRLIATCRTDRP